MEGSKVYVKKEYRIVVTEQQAQALMVFGIELMPSAKRLGGIDLSVVRKGDRVRVTVSPKGDAIKPGYEYEIISLFESKRVSGLWRVAMVRCDDKKEIRRVWSSDYAFELVK